MSWNPTFFYCIYTSLSPPVLTAHPVWTDTSFPSLGPQHNRSPSWPLRHTVNGCEPSKESVLSLDRPLSYEIRSETLVLSFSEYGPKLAFTSSSGALITT